MINMTSKIGPRLSAINWCNAALHSDRKQSKIFYILKMTVSFKQ